jgi:hypothetical protein
MKRASVMADQERKHRAKPLTRSTNRAKSDGRGKNPPVATVPTAAGTSHFPHF